MALVGGWSKKGGAGAGWGQNWTQKGKGKGKGEKGDERKTAISHSEFLPFRLVTMYPGTESKAMSKSGNDVFPIFEKMTGRDYVQLHKQKRCLEELNKIAFGCSESAACILALLAMLREQLTVQISILNPALVSKFVTKLSKYEKSLNVLDLSQDVPRGIDDVDTAVGDWLDLGTELAKPQFQALLSILMGNLPALMVGSYRCIALAGIACDPKETMAAVSHTDEAPQEFLAWKQSMDIAGMKAFFAKAVNVRVNGLVPNAAPAETQTPTDQQAALASLLADSDEETTPVVPEIPKPVVPEIPKPATNKTGKAKARDSAEEPAAKKPKTTGAAAGSADKPESKDNAKCDWCEKTKKTVRYMKSSDQYFCKGCWKL